MGATKVTTELRDALDVNYRYFEALVTARAEAQPGIRVLDFGCGGGLLVSLLRAKDIDCFGADIFYEGTRHSDDLLSGLLQRDVVREIPASGRLPFEDRSFDLIVSNMVLEHVENLQQVLAELTRVLRPSGSMHHNFPSREVLREGHIGIPLAHRIKRGRLRYVFTLSLRRLGLGSHKDGRPLKEWTQSSLAWIDGHCFYRPYRELVATFESRYRITHHEMDYIQFRTSDQRLVEAIARIGLLRPIIVRVFRRLAFIAIELQPR
jgi:SAM-dependent methyltransferase